MRFTVHAHEEWQILKSIFPIFKLALPSLDQLQDRDKKHRPSSTRLVTENAIVEIRSSFLLLPGHLNRVQLMQDVAVADFERFRSALVVFLTVLEQLVHDDVLGQPQPDEQGNPV
jgi:hypothetical protein